MDGQIPQENQSASQLWAKRYFLERPLGEGGMAIVWRAWDRRLKAWRAIKILRARYSAPTKLRNRFELEAQSMASLSHPHIVTVHDIGEQNGQMFIVMEWLSGGALHSRIQRAGPIPPRIAADVIVNILSALQAAHDAGIVHRDVKPSNILLDSQGRPVLTDFGIARVGAIDHGLTRTGVTMGTIGFMAPEQREDARSVDHRADIYAAGATLWSLISGRGPLVFVAPESRKTLDTYAPRPLADIIWRATRYNPEDRFSSATEMSQALQECIHLLPEPPDNIPPLAASSEPSTPPDLSELSPQDWISQSSQDSQSDSSDHTWAPAENPFTHQHQTLVALDETIDDTTSVPIDKTTELQRKPPPPPPTLSPLRQIAIIGLAVCMAMGLLVWSPTLFQDTIPVSQNDPINQETTENEPTEDEPVKDEITEDGNSEDGNSEDGNSEDGNSEDQPTEDGSTEDQLTEDGSTEDGPTEDGSTEDETTEDGSTEDETTEESPPVVRPPQPPPAHVTISGDAVNLRLRSDSGRLHSPTSTSEEGVVFQVPPGIYTLEGYYPNRERFLQEGIGELHSDSRVHMRCGEAFALCKFQ